MFGLKVQINFSFYILLINFSSKVATYPTHQNFSLCNCVLLQSCEVFNKFIDNSSNETHIKAVIKEAVCYFDGFNIFVCCLNKLNIKRNNKEKPNLDYLDEQSGLNCPPSFGSEYNYDDYLKSHEIKPKYGNHSHTIQHNYDADILCEVFGNCGSFVFPQDNTHSTLPGSSQQFPSHYHHDHKHPHDYHLGHNMHVPFFPHSHKNQHKIKYPLQTITSKNSMRINNKCGILSPSLINNIEVYPWITRLAYLNTTSRTIRYRCMGTIISDQYILTAAHCVNKLVHDLRLIYVRVGDDVNFDDYKILEIIVHPNYNEPLFNNDVALLRLAITSQAKDPLTQICLPQNNSNSLSGDTGIVAGWSINGFSKLKNSTIRYINLIIMNNTECAIRYAKYSENFETSIVITPTEFCAKSHAMNDVCEGDSGGPFMKLSKTGHYTLLGIVAFGPKTNCGQSNLPGVYMRISSYIDWIQVYIKSFN